MDPESDIKYTFSGFNWFLIHLESIWATGQESFWQSCVRSPSDGVQSLYDSNTEFHRKSGLAPAGLYGWSRIQYNEGREEAEHVPNPNSTWLTGPAALSPLTKHIYSETRTLYPLGRCGAEAPDEEWGRHMPAEPSIPPTGSTNNEVLKGSTGWGGAEGFFFSPQSSSAWFLPWSAHSWTFNSFQLPNVGASATSDSESRAIVTATELVLSFKLGGLGNHNAEQLTRWEWPRRLLFFILVCGEAGRAFYSALFQNSTGTFTLLQATVLLQRIIPLNTCSVQTNLATMTRRKQRMDDHQ